LSRLISQCWQWKISQYKLLCFRFNPSFSFKVVWKNNKWSLIQRIYIFMQLKKCIGLCIVAQKCVPQIIIYNRKWGSVLVVSMENMKKLNIILSSIKKKLNIILSSINSWNNIIMSSFQNHNTTRLLLQCSDITNSV